MIRLDLFPDALNKLGTLFSIGEVYRYKCQTLGYRCMFSVNLKLLKYKFGTTLLSFVFTKLFSEKQRAGCICMVWLLNSFTEHKGKLSFLFGVFIKVS